jgi:hypothetical protein
MDPPPIGQIGMKDLVDNPVEVVLTLDGERDHEVSRVVYGRGGLRLGYENPLQA